MLLLIPAFGGTIKSWFHGAVERLRARPKLNKTLYLASSDEERIPKNTQRLAEALGKVAPAGLHCQYLHMAEERHSTVFHPAALKAFRRCVQADCNQLAEGQRCLRQTRRSS